MLTILLLLQPLLASPCGPGMVCDLVSDVAAATGSVESTETRSAPAEKTAESPRPRGSYHLLGQDFGSLQEVHDWVKAQSEDPNSTVRLEPELRITITPGTIIHQQQATVWTWYNPGQKLVIDGSGAVVSGLDGGHPTPGYFLSYRPVVGEGTSKAAPAAANLEIRDLTVRGYESGGVEISPQTAAGDAHRWDGGITAFVQGAVIESNHFEDLGSLDTPKGEANWAKQRYGAGGVLMRGVSNSRISDNVFEHLENGAVKGTNAGPHLIHAIYMRDSSSNNSVTGNRFIAVSGDPIRVCNASNDNVVRGNRLRNAGTTALVSEFYNPTAGEADSTGNQISANDLGRLYQAESSSGKAKKAPKYHESTSTQKRPDLAG